VQEKKHETESENNLQEPKALVVPCVAKFGLPLAAKCGWEGSCDVNGEGSCVVGAGAPDGSLFITSGGTDNGEEAGATRD
jgi:hypothetical protein